MTPAELVKKLPKKIRVGGYDFHIVLDTNAKSEDHGGFDSVNQQMIFEASPVTRLRAVDTFEHELKHAIYYAYGLAEDAPEEAVATVTGKARAQIYRDNPWVLAWLKAGTRR